jgi:hypothetical protein
LNLGKAKWAWIIGASGLIIFDVIMFLNNTPRDTLSEYIWDGNVHPMFIFAAGVVTGHLFWQRSCE